MASQVKYQNVRQLDDDHDDASTTEVEESLMGDQKQFELEEFQQNYTKRRSLCLSILKGAHWCLEVVLLLVIVGLLLRDQSQHDIPKTSVHDVGGDMTGCGPHCTYLAASALGR